MVLNHIWTDPRDLAELRARFEAIDAELEWHVLLLTLPLTLHRARIERRQAARATDETAFEWRTLAEERAALDRHHGGALGMPFNVDAPLDTLVERIVGCLKLGAH